MRTTHAAMASSTPLRVASIVLALVAGVTAQYTAGAIASCADFSCTVPRDGLWWTLGGQRYRDAGMIPFESPLSDQALTWTLAQRVDNPSNASGNFETVQKDFYLGTPPAVDLSQADYYGCALFFLDSNATFPAPSYSYPDWRPGPTEECPSVIGQDCVDALQQRADSFQRSISSSQDLCAGLQNALLGAVPDACFLVTNQSSWGQVEARRKSHPSVHSGDTLLTESTKLPAITGPNAPTSCKFMPIRSEFRKRPG